MTATVTILKFDPLTLELPPVSEIEGKLVIVLPPVHLVVYDLSFDGLLPGAHIGADYPLVQLTVTLAAPMSIAQVVAMIVENLPQTRVAWAAAQAALKGVPLL